LHRTERNSEHITDGKRIFPNRVISGAGRHTNEPARARVSRVARRIADMPDSLAEREGFEPSVPIVRSLR
jgi:hypothetical protein